MSIENSKTQLTINQLNNSYIKLIKMFLNGDYSSSSPYINSFYYDLSPDDAYSLLNKILSQNTSSKKEKLPETHQTINKKFGLKRALTSMPEQNGGYTSNFNDDLIRDIKFSPSKYQKAQDLNISQSQQQKNQKLRRITARITQVFSSNNKKIEKYEEISKYQSDSMSNNNANIMNSRNPYDKNRNWEMNENRVDGFVKY